MRIEVIITLILWSPMIIIIIVELIETLKSEDSPEIKELKQIEKQIINEALEVIFDDTSPRGGKR